MFPEPLSPDHPLRHTPVIWHPVAARNEFGAVMFRRQIKLRKALRNLPLFVTASQRFELYLDGQLIARGPSRSDPDRWNCVTVKIPQLPAGEHVLAARVIHYGRLGGKAQLGGDAFFALASRNDIQKPPGPFDTGKDWRCLADQSFTPVIKHPMRLGSIQTGCGEAVDGSKFPWGWNTTKFIPKGWLPARVLLPAIFNEWGNRPLQHELQPDPLPQMEEKEEAFQRLWKMKLPDGKTTTPETPAIVNKHAPCVLPLQIAPKSCVRIILDRGELTNAYPAITVSGGKAAHITMVGAEAPRFPGSFKSKGNRDEIDGKVFAGTVDSFISDGGKQRIFTTSWFRSFRYLVLEISTAQQALVINAVNCRFSGYPMRHKSKIKTTGQLGRDLARREKLSWRTQRLCSHETFFDCPHYEQGQFPGDTRIQAVYHYLAANDDRLARKAIDDFHASRNSSGLLSSHHPLNSFHAIPTYSLQWIGMLYDFIMYRGDKSFINRYLPAAREILAWFDRKKAPDGMLGFIPDAPFIDWTPAFTAGNAPQEKNGHSSILTMLFAQACQWQAALESACGFPELHKRYAKTAKQLRTATRQQCWNAARGLLADTAAQNSFSRHAQVEAVLAGLWSTPQARKALLNAERYADIIPEGTLYYTYYVIQAFKTARLGTLAYQRLQAWDRCLEDSGLTTWPETLRQDTRSDCHAWSVTPGIENLQLLLGISPAECGFAALSFNPYHHLPAKTSGRLQIPAGTVDVELMPLGRNKLQASINSPVPVITNNRRLPAGHHLMVF